MELIFEAGGELLIVTIDNREVFLSSTILGMDNKIPMDVAIMDKRNPVEKILKEHPDLKGSSEKYIRRTAIERFRKHLKSFETEEGVRLYIIKEIEKQGFKYKGVRNAKERV